MVLGQANRGDSGHAYRSSIIFGGRCTSEGQVVLVKCFVTAFAATHYVHDS